MANEEKVEEAQSAQELVIETMKSEAAQIDENADDTENTDETQEADGSEPKNDKPVIEVTEDEVDALITEKKTGVQKRIDKLVAERNNAKDSLEELRKEVEELKTKKEVKSDSPKYSQAQLDQAEQEVDRLEDEGETVKARQLEREITKHRILLARYEAEQQMNAPQRKQMELQQSIAREWNQYVNEYAYNDDKDLSLTDQSSLIYKVINKLNSENATKYSRYKEFAWNQLATDAKDIILEARYNKASNKKTKKLEKELVDSKLKTQLGSGVSSGSAAGDSGKKKYASPLDEVIAERQSVQDDTMGFKR